jgi:hypothetical protein
LLLPVMLLCFSLSARIAGALLLMCRQAEVLIQELVVLVQRSEEYTYFLTSHMRDAVNRDTEKQQAAAAAATQRHSHLQGRLSLTQLDTTAARDSGGVLAWS